MQLIGSFVAELLIVTVLCSALFWGTAGYVLNASVRSSRAAGAAIGAVFTVLGIVGLGIAAGVKTTRRRRREAQASATTSELELQTSAQKRSARALRRSRWPGHAQRFSAGGAAIFAAALLIVSVLLPLFIVRSGFLPPWGFLAVGTGFDFVAYVSGAVVIVGAIFLLRWPAAWAAILIAWFADWILFLTLVFVVLQQNLAEVLENFRVSLGGLLDDFGVGKGVGIIGIPVGGAKTAGPSVDLRNLDLTSTIHHAGVDLGPATYLVLGFAVVANVTVFLTARRLGRGDEPVTASADSEDPA